MTNQASDIFSFDSAVEWAAAYREMGLPVAASTLDVALGDLEGGHLNADIALRGLAAAESVAFAVGRGSERASEVFAGAPLADRDAAEALVPNATKLIEAIGDGDDVPAGLDDLQARLTHGAAASRDAAPVEDSAPEMAAPVPGDISGELQALREDVASLKKQMNRNFARLAQIIEGGQT